MANLILNTARKLTHEYYKVFSGVYTDFKLKSRDDYKFELDPLPYDDFIESVEAGLIDCYVLLEDDIPTGFLAYTTAISEALELNIIHCLGDENINQKRKILVSKFLEENTDLTDKLVVTYPMLGSQADFATNITHFGFKLINLAVVRFHLNSSSCTQILEKATVKDLSDEYEITPWKDKYYKNTVNLINAAFKDAVDALFDPRFKTKTGTADVIQKITTGIYGEFLPEATRVAFKDGKMCGICLVNVTGGTIANIPLIGISNKHQGLGLGKYLLQSAVKRVSDAVQRQELDFTEINASVETDNISAVKMYRHIGFKEDYSYPQAYLPCESKEIDG